MTTEPFADEHAIIEAAHRRICATEEQIYAALARIPKPPGAITCDHDDESWGYCERAGAYTRNFTMGSWDVTGDGSSGIRATVELYVEQTDTGALREWGIGFDERDGITAEDARRLAAALLDAATMLEASRSHQSEADA